ncbi:MAG TPA: AAA family ATPase [Candidatus Limnocylindrales bacterium]|nr:AAA family ATPase [Candidatus Limnocylindrales bacterium]
MSDETTKPAPTGSPADSPTPSPAGADENAPDEAVAVDPAPLDEQPVYMADGIPDPRRRIDVVRATADHAAYVVDRNRRRLIIVGGAILLAFALFGVSAVIGAVFGLIQYAPLLFLQIGMAAIYIVFYFGLIFWFLSRPRKYVVTPDDPQIGLGFENYRGQPDLLEHAKSTVAILEGGTEFEKRGGEMPKGMLLSGLPGTGKTFLAACIASEAKLPFVYIDASSLRGMFWGMDSLMVMKLFRDARGLGRRYAKRGQRGACIVFLDELDSIGMARGGQPGMMGMMGMMGGGGSAGLNTLLNQMDSLGDLVEDRWRYKVLRWFGLIRGPIHPKPLVFIIGATNRPQVLDPALTRPGRLDRILEVYPPDAEGRRDIILHYLKQKTHEPDMPIEFMVADSMGWTPIMIKTIINEALVIAYEDGREQLTYKDWLAAADVRTMGLKQPIRSMLPDDRRSIAYHEAGHAVVARYLKPEDRILKASIIRAGDALGVVQRTEREERHTLHARQIEVDIMISLGSRAVEEVILGTKMAGASGDLQNASARALAYCAGLGMGSTLLVLPPTGPLQYPLPVAKMADTLLDLLMEETKRLVREKEFAVHAVAAALLGHEELIGQELEEVFLAADAANPQAGPAFERKLISLPKLFAEPNGSGNGAWQAETEAAAAAAAISQPEEGAAATEPGRGWLGPDRTTWTS